VGFNAIPKATVVPIVALMFVGQHDFNTVLIAFMISFFPIAVSVSIGLSTLEPEYRDILRSLGASNFTIFWKIALPKTLPEFFGALKVAVTLGLHRDEPDGDRLAPRQGAWRPLRQRSDQRGLPADVRRSSSRWRPWASCCSTWSCSLSGSSRDGRNARRGEGAVFPDLEKLARGPKSRISQPETTCFPIPLGRPSA
jgi:hypothetical protein